VESSHQVRVKICCMADCEEAWNAVRAGADAVGLVSAMPSGPGVIEEQQIAAIAAVLPPGVGSFLLTSRCDVNGIVAQQRQCRVNTLQFCDQLPAGAWAELRRRLPGIALVQVVHVVGPEALEEALAVASQVDAILLDSGRPEARVKELGGTGRTHDWELSRRIREAVPVPVFLAGGLRPENVGTAIRTVGPFAVDVCTGVRSAGRLDPTRLAAFIATVRAATPD
jgi:phosphoribosylanthranilate isomerase